MPLDGALNYRFVALGILLIAVGGYAFAFPQVFTPPTLVSNRTVLAQIAPGNYSAIQVTLTSQQTLQGSFSSYPENVDFFLMNRSVFSSWNASGYPPIDIYPQSTLDAKNYTFTVAGMENPKGLSLVFIAKSSNASTNLLLHLAISSEPDLTQTLAVPVVIVALGVASVAFGATRARKADSRPNET